MKSHVSDLVRLVEHIIHDASTACSDGTLDKRDIMTLKSRVEHEGMSFLTITLPTLGSDLERALDQGWIDSTHFRSFRKCGKAPAFLRGFFSRVFDIESGRILNEPCIVAIKGIRQIAYALKKLKVDCKPERVRKTLAKFVQIEQTFKEDESGLGHTVDFHSVSRVLWGSVLGNGGSNLPLEDMVPKHGPGATAERLSGNQKFLATRWHDRLEPYFPVLDNLFANANAYQSQEFEKVKVVPEEEEQPVRVIPVPKTLKGPRIIAIEPVCMQYIQQAISDKLVSLLESHWLSRRHVNFTRQDINQRLALISSKTGRFGTLDLSAASDRVPYSLAISMFDSHPDVRDAISACRSKRAQMPDGEVIHLRKFASMGSALCFPVEAMYFYTICIVARLRFHNLPATLRNIRKMRRGVFVYGDDLLVPRNESDVVAETLQEYCCKVNTAKSYWNGQFRESCGMDAFAGEQVTPVYVRNLLPRNKRSTPSIVSTVATTNQLYKAGYWKTADYLKSKVEAIIGELPIVAENCGGLGWTSYQPRLSYQRWGKKYQRPEVKTLVATPVYESSRLNGQYALAKCLVRKGSSVPFRDAKHLSRYARHGAVTLKRRWVRPY